MNAIPWRVLITVPSIAVVAIVLGVLGQVEASLLATGALIGYLGKVNGNAKATNPAP